LAHRCQSVVLDKTGTLTQGKPTVEHVETFGGLRLDIFLSTVASAEAGSEHPLGMAISEYAKSRHVRPLRLESFEAVSGMGIRARLVGRQVLIGNSRFLADQGIDVDRARAGIEAREALGETCILVAIDGRLAGLIGIADTLKEGASQAVSNLKRMGFEVMMMTGDNERAARAVAGRLGVGTVLAGVLPGRKAEEIKRLQAAGRRVAMVGDGINDAPALTQADVGVAIGTGTDVAIESADITLMRGDLKGLVRAFRLSRATMRIIKQNLFWAFIYNIIGIPLAAGVFYPIWGWQLNPMFASAAMAFSSLSVVLNSLRLKNTRLDAN